MADIVWRTTRLPDAIRGVPYEASLAVTGNATAITAGSIASGALPTGLAISADFVRITGTTTVAPGTFTVTVSLTDTAGASISAALTIVVRDADPGDDISLGANRSAAHVARLRF